MNGDSIDVVATAAAIEENGLGGELGGEERYNEEVEDEEEQQEKEGEEIGDPGIEEVGEGEEAELRPKLAEGFYEIEAVRKRRVRKGQVQYYIKWRGWAENANTWEPYENLVSCSDVIDAFEEGLRMGKHKSSRKRKRKSGGPVPQAKKKPAATNNAASGKVKFTEENFVIPSSDDVTHKNCGKPKRGCTSNDEASEQVNESGSVVIPPEIKDEVIHKNSGKPKSGCISNGEALEQGNEIESIAIPPQIENGVIHKNSSKSKDGRISNDEASEHVNESGSIVIPPHIEDEVIHKNCGKPKSGHMSNDEASEQVNESGSVVIPPQIEEGKEHNEVEVNVGQTTGTPCTPFTSEGSNKLANDIQESETSEVICLENGGTKVDGQEVVVQARSRLGNRRRKPVSVKRFNQEDTLCVTNYAAQDVTIKNTRSCDIIGQQWDQNPIYMGNGENGENGESGKTKFDDITNTFVITKIIKPVSFGTSESANDISVTFLAMRSDGKEVMVDNKYLKSNNPLLLINYYEQHLNYNAVEGPGRDKITG